MAATVSMVIMVIMVIIIMLITKNSTKSGIPHLPINDVDQGGGNLLASPKRKMAKVSENKPHNVLELLSTIIITSIIIMKYYIACIAMCEVVKPNETDSVLYFPVVVSYHVEQYS